MRPSLVPTRLALSVPAALMAAPVAVMMVPALAGLFPVVSHAQFLSGGTYEYVSPETTGTLRLEPVEDRATVLIETERDRARCRFLDQGQFDGNEARFDLPDGVLTVRLFDDNAEVETTGSARSICDAGGRVAGIYISTSPNISLNRDHIVTVQENLAKIGLPVGPIDGLMGPRTQQAMNRFEARNNLPERQAVTLATYYHLLVTVGDAVAAATRVEEIEVADDPVAGDGDARLDFLEVVPDRYRTLIDSRYGDLVAPQQIDWDNPPFEIALVDLSTGEPAVERDRPDLVTFFNDRRFCDAQRCRVDVLRSEGETYRTLLEERATEVALGDNQANGLIDVVLDGADRWRFDGERYTRPVYEPVPVR